MFHYQPRFIRNFSIIAHIDHGKSTLADRLLEITDTVPKREMKEQILDAMELERERGITIKAHPVTMFYTASDRHVYQINFIDTPGHVDFAYEVSRSLAACEGALLIVDAVQGIQAQTLANVHKALERKLHIIPIINKIDLPAADPDDVKRQIEEMLTLPASHAVLCSAKTGQGVNDILEHIIYEIPPPEEPTDSILRALVFDSRYDTYRGVMVYVRLFCGEITQGTPIRFLATGKTFDILTLGIFSPEERAVDSLRAGEVGFFTANIKNTSDVKIGDTVTSKTHGTTEPLPGFKIIKPVVYAGIYPVDSSDFAMLTQAMAKLQLNDSALHAEQESSQALGFGLRCGFLGLLHLEITFERLQREFGIDIITTAPSVSYHVYLMNGEMKAVDNPVHFPDPSLIDTIEEPWCLCHIMTPADYLGAIMNLCMEKRGIALSTETLDATRLLLTYEIPMNEMITDFHDKLKSVTQGYASFDYEPASYKKGEIIKLEIKVNEEVVDAFSLLIHRAKAESKGRAICKKLLDLIPRQQFKVPIQAAIGGKIVARETLSALSKNVTAKCYGGDITRKRKLWEKQKKGKKRMKEIGKVSIPQSAFMDVLKSE